MTTPSQMEEPVLVNAPPPYAGLNHDDKLPTVMTYATSDPSGGAGIEADLKTITAHKCYGLTCIVAITAQTPVGVSKIVKSPKDLVEAILDGNLRDMRVDVIKTGMLTRDATHVLRDRLSKLEESARPQLVVDPVLVATSGAMLAEDDEVIKDICRLTHLSTLVTPNVYESMQIVGKETALNSVQDMIALAKKVQEVTKSKNVLLKGGHCPWTAASGRKYVTDVLVSGSGTHTIYESKFCPSKSTHGTGCTLASAISSNLAHGESLEHAVYGAIQYVHNAIGIGCNVTKSHVTENGPINHVYGIEKPLDEMVNDVCYSAHALNSAAAGTKAVNSNLKAQIRDSGSFFEFLISDPRVKPHWESYINHDFVRQIADGTLPRYKFRFFLEQDYAYLENYAQIHCISASKAPTAEDVDKSVTIIGKIKTEMEKHREKVSGYFGIKDMKHFDQIRKSDALKNYARFFLDVANRGSWEDLCVALSPCLMGYGYALINQEKNITVPEDDIYYAWCQDYLAAWFKEGMEEGKILLDRVCQMTEDWDSLCKIYAAVCELETQFWDSALAYEPEQN
ncbi:LAMI_0G15082g1_1 [Lachancea mirantina]|uniref:LAMI_0G15082g1_1 n=1 Tax=Lachancea mirantina TaxID=1230905 RepID=A0A1G4KC87_9SACH|nr:LAMI_0G15082g1_1 [Lachancea mirantina]